MQATAETLDGNRVKLSIKVDSETFSGSLDQALKQAAKTIRLPGFRPGKVPTKLVEARVGREVLREEVIRDSLPDYIREAVIQTGVDAIATEKVDVISSNDSIDLEVDVIVETRPKVSIAGYQGLSVKITSPIPTDAEIDEEINRLRNQFGKLNPVSRPASQGDNIAINIKATRNGETLDAYSVEDFVYEIGMNNVFPELDEKLEGSKSGDILKFNTSIEDEQDEQDEQGGQEATIEVLVKEVSEKVLPEPSDEWAAEASEFDTFEQLRQDVSNRIAQNKSNRAVQELRLGVANAISELVTEEIPNALVSQEMGSRLHDFQHRLETQGVPLELYLQATGQSPEAFFEAMKQASIGTVRLDLALRTLSELEDIQVSEDEIRKRIELLAESSDASYEATKDNLEKSGMIDLVTWEIRKTKALDWLEENVEVLDESGLPIEISIPRESGEIIAGSSRGTD